MGGSVKVYIAGPIAGHEDLNKPEFDRASKMLTYLGHTPINPLDIAPLDHPTYSHSCLGDPTQGGHGYGCYMIPDLRALLGCQGYTLLRGWAQSRGATVEETVAKICGLTYIDTLDMDSC